MQYIVTAVGVVKLKTNIPSRKQGHLVSCENALIDQFHFTINISLCDHNFSSHATTEKLQK